MSIFDFVGSESSAWMAAESMGPLFRPSPLPPALNPLPPPPLLPPLTSLAPHGPPMLCAQKSRKKKGTLYINQVTIFNKTYLSTVLTTKHYRRSKNSPQKSSLRHTPKTPNKPLIHYPPTENLPPSNHEPRRLKNNH